MVSNIKEIETIITSSETEALLLEGNLIKELKPFYNVLLKDDKTFPYIVISESEDFPRIFKYRTLKGKKENFFGPYTITSALDDTIKIIQKVFLLRTCSDNNFSSRKRPCLNYFLKRCSAPCVSKISPEKYLENVRAAKDLLMGKDDQARSMLVSEMREASENLDFETAAIIRDRIKSLTEIQTKQYVEISKKESIDVISIAKVEEFSVVNVLFFRCGKNVGAENFLLKNSLGQETSESVLESFVVQFYKNVVVPSVIVVSEQMQQKKDLEKILKTEIVFPKLGEYKKLLERSLQSAKARLAQESVEEYQKETDCLAKVLNIKKKINRIEVYDNSHMFGSDACGVMVVFQEGKLRHAEYRKFHIDKKTANKGDDLSMMKFVLHKRLMSKSIKILPDIIVIDGGITQFRVALDVVDSLNLSEEIKVISVVKQNNRKIGDEKILIETGKEFEFTENSEVLSFLIMLRNEAHKTAINFHRKKRQKNLSKSVLDDIPFIGVARKKKLLEHFGSVDSVKKACIEDISSVKGIDVNTARIVFDFFNKGSK